MTAGDHFGDVRARVDRAGRHREELLGVFEAHLQTHPLQARVDTHDDVAALYLGQPSPLPPLARLLFGEWLYELRAALDGLVYQLAILDTGTDPPSNPGGRAFPIRKTGQPKRGNELRGLSDRTLQWIDNMQPYNHTPDERGSTPWWLHELARIDRHRAGHVLGYRVTRFEADPHPGWFTVVPRGPQHERLPLIEDGHELHVATLRLSPDGPRDGLDVACRARWRFDLEVPHWARLATGAHAGADLATRMEHTEGWLRQSIEHVDRETRGEAWPAVGEAAHIVGDDARDRGPE